MVSTMEQVVVSRFCSATGIAMTAIFFRKEAQGKLLFCISYLAVRKLHVNMRQWPKHVRSII